MAYALSYDFVQYDGMNHAAVATVLGGIAAQDGGGSWHVTSSPLSGNGVGQGVKLFANKWYGRLAHDPTGSEGFIVANNDSGAPEGYALI